jgi:ATP-binding protein involved in chromosome partitioning
MDVRISIINKRLQKIQRIIAVASGKGGVGKSLVASCLALNLSKKGYKVGLLDIDLYGPSSHVILGIKKQGFPEEDKGILPPEIHGIKFMSIVYFSEDKPSAFRGIDVTNIIIELLSITIWDELDFLIIDMPPGIGDETLDVIQLIKKSEFLVVTTPSKVSMSAVYKLLIMLIELKLPVIGVIENMKMREDNYVLNSVLKLKLPYLNTLKLDCNLEDTIGYPDKLLRTDLMKDFNKIVEKII